MSGIKDSNVIGLSEIVNREAIRPDKMGDLESLDASIVPPSEYKEISKMLFKDDLSSITPRSEESDHYETEPSGSESESGESYEGGIEISESRSESSDIDIKDPLLVSAAVKGVVDFSKTNDDKKISETHSAVIEEIKRLEEVTIKRKISIPNYKERDIRKSKKYAIEIRDMLKGRCDDNKAADSIESAMKFALNILCKTLNGKREILGTKIDLTGYNIAVMHDMKELREDVVDVASSIRKKVGYVPLKIFILLKVFVLNLGATIIANNEYNEKHYFEENFSDEEDEEDEMDEMDEEDEGDDQRSASE